MNDIKINRFAVLFTVTILLIGVSVVYAIYPDVEYGDEIYYITQEDYDMIKDNFTLFGKEQAYCVYSDDVNLTIIPATIINNSIFDIYYECSGIEEQFIGRIHTHTFESCSLSKQDLIELKNNPQYFSGIYCFPDILKLYKYGGWDTININYEVLN